MSPTEINLEICRAIGIDPKTVSKVVLTLEPGELPTVVVTRCATPADADGLRTAVEMLQLVPQPPPSYAELVAPVCKALRGES